MMGKIYVIGSQKGGVGKTTSTLNLAYALRKQGKKVLAVDFDSQANLTACYGIENTGELENTIGHLMMAAIEDEKLPAMKKCIRTEDDVEKYLGLSTLAVIPAVDRKHSDKPDRGARGHRRKDEDKGHEKKGRRSA